MTDKSLLTNYAILDKMPAKISCDGEEYQLHIVKYPKLWEVFYESRYRAMLFRHKNKRLEKALFDTWIWLKRHNILVSETS